MSNSSLCNCNNAYILAKGTTTIPNTATTSAAANNDDKKVIFKNCAPYAIYISEINNTQADNVRDIDGVMPMYNLM